MNGVQCYELFGGIALKIHTFSFSLYRRIGNLLTSHHYLKKVVEANATATDIYVFHLCWTVLESER